MTGIVTETNRSIDRKANIVCPECNRETTIEACTASDHDDHTDIECPECGHVIVSQPQFDDDGQRRPIPA